MAVRYQEFIESVSQASGRDHRWAQTASEATFTALARALDSSGRQRLLSVLPAEFRADGAGSGEPRAWDEPAFVREVSLLSQWPAEQARLSAQEVLAALADREPGLVTELNLPSDLRALFTRPDPGGGVTGPTGHLAPLTPDEIAAALRRLPLWEGDTRALRRTIALPPENLDRVLHRIEIARRDLGGGVHIRRERGTAELIVKTSSVDAVTAPDVDIAERIDDVIVAAGAGMSAPSRPRPRRR